MMKKIITAAILTAVASTGLAAVIVTDDMTDLSGWNGTADWSAAAGVAETAIQGRIMTMKQGVPAPVSVGDSVTAELVQRISFGSIGHTNTALPNQYSTRLAITGDDTGGTGVSKVMFSRRNPNGNGNIWGAALTSDGGGWVYAGWNPISELGLTSTVDDVSDWFTTELVITKAVGGYDLLVNYYDSSSALVWTDDNLGLSLGDLAGQSTWYLNMGSEYQMTDHDITLMEVDSATLTSSIPEPATIGLLGLSGVALYIRRKYLS